MYGIGVSEMRQYFCCLCDVLMTFTAWVTTKTIWLHPCRTCSLFEICLSYTFVYIWIDWAISCLCVDTCTLQLNYALLQAYELRNYECGGTLQCFEEGTPAEIGRVSPLAGEIFWFWPYKRQYFQMWSPQLLKNTSWAPLEKFLLAFLLRSDTVYKISVICPWFMYVTSGIGVICAWFMCNTCAWGNRKQQKCNLTCHRIVNLYECIRCSWDHV